MLLNRFRAVARAAPVADCFPRHLFDRGTDKRTNPMDLLPFSFMGKG